MIYFKIGQAINYTQHGELVMDTINALKNSTYNGEINFFYV